MGSDAPRRRGRPRDAPPPEVRRAQLLDAALRAVRRDGARVSMDDVAHEAGLSKPVLYTHFGDKAGLGAAIAAHVGDTLAGEIGQALDPARPPRAQIRAAVAAFVRWVREEPALFDFLVNTPSGTNPKADVLGITRRVAAEIAPGTAALLELHGRDPAHAAELANGIVGFVYLAVEWSADPDEAASTDDALVERLTAFVWAGITGDADPA